MPFPILGNQGADTLAGASDAVFFKSLGGDDRLIGSALGDAALGRATTCAEAAFIAAGELVLQRKLPPG
jgi:hypothetical protein